jgi:hypothetical protein
LNGLKENVIIGRKIPVGTGVDSATALDTLDEDIVEADILEDVELAA